VGGPEAADLGGFLTPQGTLAAEFQGDALLFVPPSDVVPGTQIQVVLRGAIWDRCPEQNELDGPNGHSDNTFIDCNEQSWELAVAVNVGRDLEGKYTVGVPPHYPPQCSILEPTCQASYNPCCHLIGTVQYIAMETESLETPEPDPSLVPVINVESAPLPEEGMFLGEIRPICVNFRDLDKVAAECGHGSDPECPQANPKDFKKICDRVVPIWSIVAGPNTGDGEFLWAEGRVALFRATKAGPLEITVRMTDAELLQSAPFVEIEFPIKRVTVKSISFAGGHDVLMDAENGDGLGSPARSPYVAPHWRDHDLAAR